MTDVNALLGALVRSGVRLSVVDGRLDVRAPEGVLTAALRSELARHRDDLVAVLRQPTRPGAVRPRPDLRYEPFPLTDVQRRPTTYGPGTGTRAPAAGASACRANTSGSSIARTI